MKKALISIVIFVLGIGLGGVAQAAGSATFGFEPSIINTALGDTFTIDVIAYPNGELIDTARALVQFDDDALELQYYELGDLLPNAAPGNYVDNSNGFVSMGGYLKGTQTSESGVYATVVFKSKLVGTSSLRSIEGTKMISIGDERIDLEGSSTASITVYSIPTEDMVEFEPESAEVDLPGEPVVEIDQETGEEIEVPSALKVVSLSHPSQNEWQALSEVGMSWKITGAPTVEITEYYYSINKEPQADPGTDNSTPDTNISIDNVEDGIWYFHIKALLSDGSYSEAAHYRVLVDTEAPGPVVPVLDVESIEAGKSVYLRFRTTDQTSGIWYYEIEANDELYSTRGSEMLLENMSAGKHKLVVRAYDKAGNWVQGETTLTVGGSIWQRPYLLFGILFIALVVVLLIFRKRKK